MNIPSSTPSGSAIQTPGAPVVPHEELALRRELLQAAKSVNNSGILGANQLVFMVDRATHRVVIRVVDRDTHEVLLQLPPEYVMRLAQGLSTRSAHTLDSETDT